MTGATRGAGVGERPPRGSKAVRAAGGALSKVRKKGRRPTKHPVSPAPTLLRNLAFTPWGTILCDKKCPEISTKHLRYHLFKNWSRSFCPNAFPVHQFRRRDRFRIFSKTGQTWSRPDR